MAAHAITFDPPPWWPWRRPEPPQPAPGERGTLERLAALEATQRAQAATLAQAHQRADAAEQRAAEATQRAAAAEERASRFEAYAESLNRVTGRQDGELARLSSELGATRETLAATRAEADQARDDKHYQATVIRQMRDEITELKAQVGALQGEKASLTTLAQRALAGLRFAQIEARAIRDYAQAHGFDMLEIDRVTAEATHTAMQPIITPAARSAPPAEAPPAPDRHQARELEADHGE